MLFHGVPIAAVFFVECALIALAIAKVRKRLSSRHHAGRNHVTDRGGASRDEIFE